MRQGLITLSHLIFYWKNQSVTRELKLLWHSFYFTEKQKEDPSKLFDLVVSSGLYEMIIHNIPHAEVESLQCYINSTIAAVYEYRNSVLGLFETITSDYSALNLDASEIHQKLADPNNM